MSSRRQIENKIGKAKYGPSVNEVVIGAALSLLLGAALATTYMVTTPVKVVRELPKEPEQHVVYYTEGTRFAEQGKQWMRKKQLFLEGSSVNLNENELNAWIRAETGTPPPPPPKPGAGLKAVQPPPPPPPALFQVDGFNFRIHDGVMQVSCRVTLNLELFNLSLPLVAQAAGHFERRGDVFTLVPDKCYVGSFPVHRVPGLDRLTLGFLLARVPVTEEVRAAWKKVTNAAVDGDTLRLSMP